MILNITKDNKTISIHCDDYIEDRDNTTFYGVYSIVKTKLYEIGIRYRTESDNTISISRQKMADIKIEKQEPRTQVECKFSELAYGEIYLHIYSGRTQRLGRY